VISFRIGDKRRVSKAKTILVYLALAKILRIVSRIVIEIYSVEFWLIYLKEIILFSAVKFVGSLAGDCRHFSFRGRHS
jgi:hypothetical protein